MMEFKGKDKVTLELERGLVCPSRDGVVADATTSGDAEEVCGLAESFSLRLFSGK